MKLPDSVPRTTRNDRSTRLRSLQGRGRDGTRRACTTLTRTNETTASGWHVWTGGGDRSCRAAMHDRRPVNRLKRYLSRSRLYVFGTEVKWRTLDCWKRLDRTCADRAVVRLPGMGATKGSVLLSYFVDPFLDPERLVAQSHPQYWVSAQLARHFIDLGYTVDVISYRNQAFQPEKPYDIVIDARHNLERLCPNLPDHCLKIFLIDSANILFHNAAEASRLLALQQRRGITLQARRHERPNRGIECADCGVMFGNEFTLSTFRYAN